MFIRIMMRKDRTSKEIKIFYLEAWSYGLSSRIFSGLNVCETLEQEWMLKESFFSSRDPWLVFSFIFTFSLPPWQLLPCDVLERYLTDIYLSEIFEADKNNSWVVRSFRNLAHIQLIVVVHLLIKMNKILTLSLPSVFVITKPHLFYSMRCTSFDSEKAILP